MASRSDMQRLRLSVMLIDSTKLVEFKIKSGEVVSVTEQDYDSELKALQFATSKRGRKLLLWCGLVTARVARPANPAEHPDAAELADAQYLKKVFGADHFVAMQGAVALSPDAQTEVIEHLAATKPQMVLSGLCVGEQDGIWLRVGRRNVEATLVHEGQISGWIALCEGMDSVVTMIRGGQSAVEARSQLANQVVSEVRMAIMQWQRTRTVPPQIWLHGPGGDPSGEVHQALLLHSGCRVAPPNMETSGTLELSLHIPLLPTVVHALKAPLLRQPQAVLKQVDAAKRRILIKAAAAMVIVLFGITSLAAFMGNRSKNSLENIEKQIDELKPLVSSEIQERANELKEVESLLANLSGEESPNWTMLFRLGEVFGHSTEGITVQSNQTGTSVSTRISSTDEYAPLMKELDEWAKAIYGPDAYARGGGFPSESSRGEIEVSASLGLHAEVN